MIYELRTYQFVVGGLPEYLELARTLILPAIGEYGIKPVGFWTSESGSLHQAIHLWAYADLNDRQAKWAAWAKDPRRKEVLAKLRPLLVGQHKVFLSPTEFSPLQ